MSKSSDFYVMWEIM